MQGLTTHHFPKRIRGFHTKQFLKIRALLTCLSSLCSSGCYETRVNPRTYEQGKHRDADSAGRFQTRVASAARTAPTTASVTCLSVIVTAAISAPDVPKAVRTHPTSWPLRAALTNLPEAGTMSILPSSYCSSLVFLAT